MKAKCNLYLTACDNEKRRHLVAEGHAAARFLVIREGDPVPATLAERFGIPEELIHLQEEQNETEELEDAS